jgi:C-terminal processing protease CtpA/Prc
MTENTEIEEVEESSEGEYVTRSELESMLDTKLEGLMSKLLGDTVTEGEEIDADTWTEITDEADEYVGSMSPLQIERMMEEKVQQALAGLGVKKQARQPVKKVNGVKKAQPVKKEVITPEPEEAPSVPGKMSISKRLWG